MCEEPVVNLYIGSILENIVTFMVFSNQKTSNSVKQINNVYHAYNMNINVSEKA